MTKLTGNRPNGVPCWGDLRVPDIGRAKDFYGTLFGWQWEEGRPETAAAAYATCLLEGKPVAAFIQIPVEAPAWNVYFAADDVDATAKRVADHGGKILDGPGDLMGQGRFAAVEDASGARFTLWHGVARTGVEVLDEPGSFAWFEYRTPDTGEASRFYNAVFERPVESIGVPDFDYLTVQDGEASVAGVWGVSDATPGWTVYFAVSDTDAAVATATKSGGSLVSEPHDSFYGRVAWIKDPFGADLALIARSDAAGG